MFDKHSAASKPIGYASRQALVFRGSWTDEIRFSLPISDSRRSSIRTEESSCLEGRDCHRRKDRVSTRRSAAYHRAGKTERHFPRSYRSHHRGLRSRPRTRRCENQGVRSEKTEFRHDGPLLITGRVRLKGISLDLIEAITVASGADLELDDVKIKVSDPPASTNGAGGLRCEGPAKIKIHRSTMTSVGRAHPIWWLQGNVAVDDFQTTNSEFHLDHVRATLENFTIFELEISHASQVVGRHLHLVFLSTHTGNDDKLEFSDIDR